MRKSHRGERDRYRRMLDAVIRMLWLYDVPSLRTTSSEKYRYLRMMLYELQYEGLLCAGQIPVGLMGTGRLQNLSILP
ncbi:hypothetical protein BGZ60DRAFT_414550 [Tricladium varicosporioides]|nr:hypothetical protein BGZ60DRAFT_414550 [Hymenoscyphus varicosporioides]